MSAPPLINTRRRTRGRSERARVLWFGVVLAVSRLSFVPCFQPKPPWAYACGASSTNSTNSTSSTSRRTRGYTTQTKKTGVLLLSLVGQRLAPFFEQWIVCWGGSFVFSFFFVVVVFPFRPGPPVFVNLSITHGACAASTCLGG